MEVRNPFCIFVLSNKQQMRQLEYAFEYEGLLHVVQYKPSQNSKIGLGYIVQTYHLSMEQVKANDLSKDSKNCLDCPLSMTNGGGCYTHKGFQRMGIMSMLKSKSKGFYPQFSQADFDRFLSKLGDISLVRFGAYGEPVLLPSTAILALINKSKGKYTGYTHQWRKGNHQFAMASVHTLDEAREAISLGYRPFLTMDKASYDSLNEVDKIWLKMNFIGCPAAKESKYNKTCIQCGLCNGNSSKNKGIFILMH